MERLYWRRIINSKISYGTVIAVIGIVYFFTLGDNGPYLMRDSEAFLNPTPALLQSYWLYTNFLQVCKYVFGQKFFLEAIFILQGILALITSVWVTEYFRKYFSMGYLSGLLVYICVLLPYGYSLPENVVTHHIMTEALSIPLFYICLLFSCKTFLEENYYYMIIVTLMGILLILSRSQLLICVPAIAFLFAIIFVKESVFRIADRIKVKREIAVAFFTLFLSGFLTVLIYMTFTKTTIGSQLTAAISGRVMCLMEYDDRELFEGETQEIYDALFKNADEGGHIKKYFRTDSWRPYDIAVHTNENTKEGLAVIRDFYSNKFPEKDLSKFALKSYSDRDFIIATLFWNHFFDYIIMSIQLMSQSFVASVFIQPDLIRNLCYVITFFIYLGTFGVMYIAGRRMKVDKSYIIPMLLTLLFLVSNVILTNIIFYGQQRYVIYTFGMFYLSWFIMVLGIYRKRKEQAKSE